MLNSYAAAQGINFKSDIEGMYSVLVATKCTHWTEMIRLPTNRNPFQVIFTTMINIAVSHSYHPLESSNNNVRANGTVVLVRRQIVTKYAVSRSHDLIA